MHPNSRLFWVTLHKHMPFSDIICYVVWRLSFSLAKITHENERKNEEKTYFFFAQYLSCFSFCVFLSLHLCVCNMITWDALDEFRNICNMHCGVQVTPGSKSEIGINDCIGMLSWTSWFVIYQKLNHLTSVFWDNHDFSY